jgi:hypothetical protein
MRSEETDVGAVPGMALSGTLYVSFSRGPGFVPLAVLEPEARLMKAWDCHACAFPLLIGGALG